MSKMDTSNGSSTSATHRSQGNALFRSATDDLAPTLRRSRLEKALACYHESISTASNEQQKFSACKNYALTAWKLSMLVKDLDPTKPNLFLYYFSESMRTFSSASKACSKLTADQKHSLFDLAIRFLDDVFAVMQDQFEFKERLRNFTDLFNLCRFGEILPKLQLEIVTTLFHFAVELNDEFDHKQALYQLHECNSPLTYVLDRGDSEQKAEAEVLQADILSQFCIAESSLARLQGDAILDRFRLDTSKRKDVRAIWTAIDFYREAIIKCRDIDLEYESHAFSRLATAYHEFADILCVSRWKARESAIYSIRLAEGMAPRNFFIYEWYRDAARVLEHYEAADRQAEEAKWENRRKPFVEELKEELEGLNAKKTSRREFIKHIYAKHPPTHKENVSGPDDPLKLTDQELKQSVRRALVHYHPDTIDEEVHTVKYKVLCEEICKILNNFYGSMKGID